MKNIIQILLYAAVAIVEQIKFKKSKTNKHVPNKTTKAEKNFYKGK